MKFLSDTADKQPKQPPIYPVAIGRKKPDMRVFFILECAAYSPLGIALSEPVDIIALFLTAVSF